MGVDTVLRPVNKKYEWWRGYSEVDKKFLWAHFEKRANRSQFVEHYMDEGNGLYLLLTEKDLATYLRIANEEYEELLKDKEDEEYATRRADDIFDNVIMPIELLLHSVNWETQEVMWSRN